MTPHWKSSILLLTPSLPSHTERNVCYYHLCMCWKSFFCYLKCQFRIIYSKQSAHQHVCVCLWVDMLVWAHELLFQRVTDPSLQRVFPAPCQRKQFLFHLKQTNAGAKPQIQVWLFLNKWASEVAWKKKTKKNTAHEMVWSWVTSWHDWRIILENV